jgi:transposase
MWTETTRGDYERRSGRYSSDLTNEEFALIEVLLPARRHLGRPRSTDFREVINAVLYLLRTGCQWAMLPKDFPPSGTVYGYFRSWKRDGVWARVHYKLLMAVREQCGREASPTAVIIDSQSVKTTESGGISGHDGGKKIKGRKRHIVVDTEGFLLQAVVHEASTQDRNGAVTVFKQVRKLFTFLELIWADGGYRGPKLAKEFQKIAFWKLKIVKRNDKTSGFEVLPRRWVVERTFAWMGRNRRLAKDFEKIVETSMAYLEVAMIQLMIRRLARP